MKKLISLLLGVIMLFSCMVATAETTPFESSIDWDAEYDVIVVGLGAAGCSTAITAAQKGAKVLVLEKAPEGHAGGNSAVCMQWIAMVDNKDQAKLYMQSMRAGFETPTDEMIDVFVDGISQNAQWLTDLGAPNVSSMERIEFPDLDGAGGIYMVTVDGNFGIASTGTKPSGAAYKFLKKKVESFDNIDVWYEAPAKHLIQDKTTRIVHGVEAEIAGEQINVRAKNGVVLCCGGYENNSRMLEDYNDIHGSSPLGYAMYNTGDGIFMAQEVGARLWHMANVVWPDVGYRFESGATTFLVRTPSGLQVANKGEIYNSLGSNKHGKTYFYGDYVRSIFPSVSYVLWDKNSVALDVVHNSFSEDKQWEIEHGYYQQADTIEELAEKTGLDAETLKASVATFNETAEHPIVEAPFYALRVSHAVVNTQGGPERGTGGEVIDLYGNPIPHLYEAGELGDIWSHCYQASCNIGGGLAFGRISGENAAEPKTDNYQGSVMEGKTAYTPVVEEKVYEAGENQYIGKGEGKSTVPIVVRVTKEGEDITNVEILEDWETPGFTDRAKDQTISMIIERDTPVVDVVSGATMTSVGIMSAVSDALASK